MESRAGTGVGGEAVAWSGSSGYDCDAGDVYVG